MAQPRVLTLASHPIRLSSRGAISGFAESRGVWTLSERVGRTDAFSGSTYEVVLDTRIEDDEDPGLAFMGACDVARDVDRAFNYATGWPLLGKSFRYLLEPQSVPRAWRLTAGAEHVPAGDWELLEGIASNPRTRTLPDQPLRATLRVLEALGQAGPIIAELGALHYAALSTHDAALAPLLLAKGLEAARELLPGGDLKSKHSALPASVRTHLPRNLAWYYDVANNRRETRHVVDKRSSVVLKDALSDDERAEFQSGADLLLNFIIVSQLGLPLILCDSEGVSREAS
jgi:hypothetical protein